MPDLVVDTSAQRAAAADLRSAAQMAGEAQRRSGRLAAYVPAVGAHRPARALSAFLDDWSYGMGLIRHDTEILAGFLVSAADAFDAVERELSRAAGSGTAVVAPVGASVTDRPAMAVPDPPRRPAPELGWGSLPGSMPVTLSNATHWRQLIPGEPDDVSTLAAQLRQFAVAAHDGASALARLSTGAWQGRAAAMFAGHVEEAPARLRTAAEAFAAASRALDRYGQDLYEAQTSAAQALRIWQDAQTRATAPELPGAAAAQDEQARAATMLARARDNFEDAGHDLARVLDDAGEAAPDRPGLLASIARAITSFTTGVGEGTVGMVTGVASLVALGVKLSPARAVIDPDGYLDTLQGVLDGAKFMATHPSETAKALVDWETWADDPARAAGRLVPDLLATIATAGAGGAVKASSATRRLDDAADAINRRGGDVLPRLDHAELRERVSDLGYDPDAPSGQAAAWQVDAPYGAVDVWTDTTLKAGDRIAVGVGGPMSGFAVPITGNIAAVSAREWFEAVQVAPRRLPEGDGPVPPPTVRSSVAIYEVSSELPAASASTAANTQFGAGGAGQLYIPGAPVHVADGSLLKVSEHHFDPATTRAAIEDPRFKAVDPSLPDRPLDPAHEGRVGRAEGAAAGIAATTSTSAEHQPPTGAAQ